MRFSIRDMLWLTALAALAACWLSDRQRMTETKAELKEQQDLARKEQDTARAEAAASRKQFEDLRQSIKTLDAQVRMYQLLTPAPTQLRRED
jgi:uncharacterized protein YlxW (UPF0749 family)